MTLNALLSFYSVIAPGGRGGDRQRGGRGGGQGKKNCAEEGVGQVWVTTEEKAKIERRERRRVGSVKITYNQVPRTSPFASGLSEPNPRVRY